MISFEKAKQKLLSVGFKEIENKEEDGVEIFGTFGINYCSCCKRADCIISIFKQKDEEDDFLDEPKVEYQIITNNFDSQDDLTAANLNYELKELKEYGIIKRKNG
jgi:hypothetical protein